jgi:2-polyprenyl-3-methyl-5-hydroxy-6-metoxy-1,4-benzoquinol methylase
MSGEPFQDQAEHLNREAQADWERIAGWWDAQVGENANLVVRPAVRRLLDLSPNERVLELACGNGALARELARDGAQVLATDFSATFLRLAEERTRDYPDLADRIEYRLVDATDPAQLASLGSGQEFDAAVCVMGLMDMPVLDPLMSAVARLLKPNGRFVWSVVHPCFNTRGGSMMIEQEDRGGELVTTYAVKITRYLEPLAVRGLGIIGQPVPHYSFERPLSMLLASGFRAGLVLDGLEEICPPVPDDPSRLRTLSWARFQDIPAFLAARMRPRAE